MTGPATGDSTSQLDHIPSVVSLLTSFAWYLLQLGLSENKPLVETTEGMVLA